MFFRLISTSPSAIPPELLKERSAVRQMSPYGAPAAGEVAEAGARTSPPPDPSVAAGPVEEPGPTVAGGPPELSVVDAPGDEGADADADAGADAAASVPSPLPLPPQAVSVRAAVAAVAKAT